MQEQRFVASNSVTDPLTGIRYELGADGLRLSKQGQGEKIYPIGSLSSQPRKKNSRFYLRFVRKNQGLVSVSPQGTLITCRSDRIQEVEMNVTLERGQIWWELFVPHTTLFLTVGVKDTKTNLTSAFDFCLKHSAKLQFKLNVDNLSFKTWINGIPSEAKPALIVEKGHQWTPFVRVREIGTSLAVSSLIADPENILSEYNPFHTAADIELGTQAHKIEEVEQIAFDHNERLKFIQWIDTNNLLLSGESDIRLIKRNKNTHIFNVEGLLQKTKSVEGESERYLIEITNQELKLLLKSQQLWGTSIIGVVIRHSSKLWVSKTKQEWAQWTKAACLFLDKQLRDNTTHQLAFLIYRWILSKVQSLRAILDDLLKINELNSFDSDLVNAIDRNIFHQRKNNSLPIQPTNYINNISYHTFSQPILGNTSSQHYIFFKFAANKISVFSIRNSLFKVGDFIISKAIKKQNQINQFKKEAQDIKDNDFTKPSIYKILKNCLKYADKVKPPEKLIKELEQKKALIKEKEKVQVKKVENELVPDKQLQNTLIQMGFDINIARKALIQCKNSSLEAAMDLILSGNLKVEPVAKVEAPKRQWTCQTCTLVNAGNVAVCAACDSAAPPIEMIQEKKEIIEEVQPVIEEEIKSEKIQEQLKEVYPFETNIGFIPLVVGGVFSTQLRFRLFCLNPRFYSSFYEKGDAYANLIDNTLNDYIHQITSKQIEDLSFSYFDQAELKEKYFAWIPIEDYDMSAENVRSIRYEVVGFEKENFGFKAFITYADKTSCLTFNINTSNVYLEKQRSFTLIKEEKTEEIAPKTVEVQQPEEIVSENCRNVNLSPKYDTEFQAIFVSEGNPQFDVIEEIEATLNEQGNHNNFLHLSVVKNSQTCTYPHVSFVSPWKESYISSGFQNNSLVLGHLQRFKIVTSVITLQLANKQEKISGFVYFSNNYELLPLKKYHFHFKGNKKLSLRFEDIESQYVVIVLEPHEDRLIELSNVNVYGAIVQGTSNTSSVKYEIPEGDLNIKVNQIQSEQNVQLVPSSVESSIVNSKYDLSFLSQQEIASKLQQLSPSLFLKIKVDSNQSTKNRNICLSEVSVKGFRLLSINTVQTVAVGNINSEELKAQFNNILNEYLLTCQKNLLQALVSDKFANFKSEIKDKQLKEFILNHVARTPFNADQKLYIEIFINLFANELCTYKSELGIKNLIVQGLKDVNLTAFGLQLLLHLNKITKSINASELLNLSLASLRQIKEWKSLNKQNYNPYEQTSIFSTYIHQIFTKEHNSSQVKNIDSIHQKIVLKKHKFNRRYVLDFYCVHSIRSLDLIFQETKTRNKMIVTLRWVDQHGNQVGFVNHFIDYPQWTQLAQHKNGKNGSQIGGTLSLDVSSSNIQTRYLIIDCNFTLRPLNGSKAEIQSLADRQIIPIAYGLYIGEQAENLSICPDFSKNARFICKTLNFSKYSISNKGDHFYYQQEELRPESGDLASLADKLQLKQNKQKWVRIQMNNPKNDCIDFHFTLFCQIADHVCKLAINQNEELPEEWVRDVIEYVAQDEYLPIQELAVKALKHILNSKEKLNNVALNCQFKNQYLIPALFKSNPLTSESERKLILQQLGKKSQHVHLARNCLSLIKGLKNQSELENLKEVGVALLKLLINNEQQICELCNIFGWIQGTDTIFQSSQHLATKRILAKASKSKSNLIEYLKKDLAANQPNDNFWIILEELISKGVQEKDIKEVVEQFLKWIVDIKTEDESDVRIFGLFEKLIKVTVQVKFSENVNKEIIKIYFGLENRIVLLSEFLKSAFLEENHSLQALLQQVVNEVVALNTAKPNRLQNEEQLSFLADVLSFVYKTEDSPFKAGAETVGKVYSIIADFLHKFVNFGGISGCRHLKEAQINSIILAHYLTLTFSKSHPIKSADFAKLVNWYIINFSSQVNNESNALKKFRLIHSNVWNLLVSGFSDSNNASLVAMAVTQILDQAKTLKDNKFLANIYQSKVYAFLKQVLKHFDDASSNPQFLNVLLKNSNIFRRILEEIKEIKVFESNQNTMITEKELVNELKFLGEEKPKDWLEFKNIAKQHAFVVEFSKGNRQFKSLTFQSNNLFWLSEVVIGFSFNANVLAPKEITLQIGESLETMKLIGSLEYIPLESYLSQSVKVYAINLHRPSLKKWHLQRNGTSRYVRLIIKSPYSNALFQSIDFNSSTFKENSPITFISLSGYQQNGQTACPNDVHDLVDSLEILSQPRNKVLLEQLLNEDQNLASFQQSLLNLSYLMGNDNYGLKLHKFLMRVCELNTSVGNKMLQEYLQLKNPYLSSKIAAQIAGSNLLQSGKRAAQYFEFILKSLDKSQEVLPFVNKFTQMASVLQKMHHINSIASQVHIHVDEVTLRRLLQKSEGTPSFRKLLRLILTKRKPFIFEGFNSEFVYDTLYHSGSSASSELLASIITSEPECTAWFVDKSYLSEIFKGILSSIQKTQGSNVQLISNRLSFLTILCQNSQLKDIITKSQYDLKIFEILVGKEGEKLLSDSSNKLLRERLVEFIGRASLGTENERIIGTLLKESLSSMVLESSQQFVAEIFLPLLNSYSKTAISLLPFNKAESRLLTDLSGLKIHSANEKAVKKTSETFKLASHIIEDNQKNLFFDKLRENTQHKWGAFKLVTNHSKAPSFKVLEAVRKDVLRAEKSILILIEAKKKIGFFYNYSKENQINHDSIGWNRGSFAFEIDEKGAIQLFSYVYPKETLLSYERINDQYEKESDVLRLKYKGRPVVDIYFDGINSSIYHENSFKEANSSQKQRVQSVEYWTFDSESVSSFETVFVSQESFAQKLLSQLNDYTFFKTELKTENSLSLLREEPLYEFPSSITLADLKRSIEIFGYTFNQENLSSVKIKNIKGTEVKQTDTLEALAKKSGTDDLVLDLLLETDTMPAVQAKSEVKKIEYLPRKGILKYFQENDGVKAMIKVIKKSIGEWKNQVRKQKWEQYVVELENFSTFPHFFSTYLKDKDTFKMLIDLLAGLPDKETDTKWDELEVASSQKLLRLVSDILAMDSGNEFRNYALKNDFMSTILDRLRILTGIFKRKYEAEVIEEVNTNSPSKKDADDDGTKKIKKKKGVGYGNDTNSNTKWMKGENLTNAKKDFENVETILSMVEGFLNSRGWVIPQNFLNQLLESSLLPYIEDCLRAGTLLQISKHPEKFKTVLKLIRSISKHQKLLPCLLPLSNNYQPTQTESIESLLKSLYNISKIFLSCLNVNLTKEDKLSQDLANDIIQTYNLVEEAIQERDNIGKDENEFNTILSLPLDKKYRELMKDLRFDYIDMKESATKIKHHYASNFNANYTPNHNKMIRLAQELADISTALPHEHTNAIYVRCDKDRVDFMQALIMGSNGTPYGHGAFLFDVYFDDNYPNGPPKVNLTTTGHGKIRFNPNLYSCGKVCLSLLGTWRGSASQNWDAKVSTLLQVLLSIQAIIMSEEVYFNEPGFENEQGTEQGEKKNQAYSNIVRYGNVKFAMLENIKNPPKGFQAIIRRHFYLKKEEIMEQCRKWLKYAQKRAANYVGLVNDHNVSWAAQFKKSKTQYKEMLEKAIKELEEELNKLPPPKSTDIIPKHTAKKEKKRKDESKNVDALKGAKLQEIDVSYEKIEGKELDINDEKVRDRWSRYIGAMGIDAVSKQSKADILIYGLGPFGLEVVKNIVLSGCRRLTLCDEQDIKREDLSGGFFYQQEDIGKKRVDTIVQRIRQLNSYVKIDVINRKDLSLENIGAYTVVLASELAFPEQIALAMMCREKKVKYISADCRSAYCRLVNDYGDFTVLDKNGEEPIQVNLSAIQNSQRGLVVVLEGSKHPFQDGEAIVINHVQGMENLENKEKSINGTIHTVKVINSKSFEIGDTRKYGPYVRNGTAKNIKTPVNIKFRPFQASIDPQEKQIGIQPNLEYADFSKMTHEKYVQRCFIVLDQFRIKHKRMPEPWSAKDSALFLEIYTSIWKEELEKKEKKLIENFSFTCSGHLPPLCAFFGGLAAQEIVKAITQKYKPINSSLYLQFTEILPQKEEGEWTENELSSIYKPEKSRDQGFTIVVGNELAQWIKQAKLFMIGAGAIGCELLKNLAMVGLGTGKEGKIVLTDPDHIENSNLNRQFLFREKHISKPKSSTAAASVLLMNPLLKGHISALLERVSDSTKDIFSNKFFESLTVVANALDNVAARRYVDQRCVENKIPLFESGTLGPKGHVQVIIPYQTESYGSQNDPIEDGEIPHCTLKMFPEETLHCVEWARDNFGKKFTLQPKALAKFLQKGYKPEPNDIKNLNESIAMVTKGPRNFEDCIVYAVNKFYKYYRDDVMQLLYTYPLDAKTKNGEPFWRLPKRPPTPIKYFNPEDLLHCTFVTSMAVLLAKVYQIPYPQNFRSDKERFAIGKAAAEVKIHEFVPSDEKAKAILKETFNDGKKDKEAKQEEEKEKSESTEKTELPKVENINSKNEQELYQDLIQQVNGEFSIKHEEFQKDDDSNGHIDFIYSMANLRAINYKLDPMDWMTTRIKAGRIVPALATTTSCVAGLQTLQICKYLKKIKIDRMRNSYLNLAVPSLQMSEPGEVKKTKVTENLTVTLWDRWEVQCNDNITFGEVYAQLNKKYGLFPKGVLQGMSRIDLGKTEEEKKAFLSLQVLDKLEKEDNYIDIVVLFTLVEGDDKILEGLPPVRLLFKK